MKIIKVLFYIVVLALLITLTYQNFEYFMATTALTLNLKISNWSWTIPEIQNGIYWILCFVLGYFLSSAKGMLVKYRLKKEITTQNESVDTLKKEVNTLKTELEVFKHDPYIKPRLEDQSEGDSPVEDSVDIALQTPAETKTDGSEEDEKPTEA